MNPRAKQSNFQKDSNMSSSKPNKFIRPIANMKPLAEQSLHKSNHVPPEVEKAPLKPHANISTSVKENIGSVSAVRVYSCPKKKFSIENGGNGVKENGSSRGSGSSSNDNEVTLHPHEPNGFSKGGDHHKDNLHHPCKSSDDSQNGTDHQEIEKDGVITTQSKALASSTKDDPCILLRKDESSRDELEAIKESLKKDASSFLRSCGRYDQVQISMRAKKRLCTEQSGGDGEDGNNLKRRLVGDAKSSSLQIPDELKAHLVNRLRIIGKKKYS